MRTGKERECGERREKGGHECFCDVHEHEVMRREEKRCRQQKWSGVHPTHTLTHAHTHADLGYPATGSAGGPDAKGNP